VRRQWVRRRPAPSSTKGSTRPRPRTFEPDVGPAHPLLRLDRRRPLDDPDVGHLADAPPPPADDLVGLARAPRARHDDLAGRPRPRGCPAYRPGPGWRRALATVEVRPCPDRGTRSRQSRRDRDSPPGDSRVGPDRGTLAPDLSRPPRSTAPLVSASTRRPLRLRGGHQLVEARSVTRTRRRVDAGRQHLRPVLIAHGPRCSAHPGHPHRAVERRTRPRLCRPAPCPVQSPPAAKSQESSCAGPPRSAGWREVGRQGRPAQGCWAGAECLARRAFAMAADPLLGLEASPGSTLPSHAGLHSSIASPGEDRAAARTLRIRPRIVPARGERVGVTRRERSLPAHPFPRKRDFPERGVFADLGLEGRRDPRHRSGDHLLPVATRPGHASVD